MVRARPLLLLAPLLLFVSCDDDPATAPDVTPIADHGPRLVIEPATGPIGTFFEVRLAFDQGPVDDLADYELVVPWPTRVATLRVPADETGRMQVDAVGNYLVSGRIRAPDGSDEKDVDLVAALVVDQGTGDGSLDMVPVPAGSFLQGYPERRAFDGYTPQRTVQLSDFSIGRTEVTNAAFVETLQWAVSQGRAAVTGHYVVSQDGLLQIAVVDLDNVDFLTSAGPTFTIAPGHELHPASGLTWNGAALWCNWQSERDGLDPAYTHDTLDVGLHDIAYLVCDFTKNGYRLPTEAEWEKAARGGALLAGGPNPMPGRWYPWGDDLYWTQLSGGIGYLANLWQHIAEHPVPVGSFPAGRSPYGIEDMVGNVSEWVHDWFDYDYYSSGAPDQDPRGPGSYGIGNEYLAKVWRGAPAFDWVMYLETGCSSRFGRDFGQGALSMGLRVARSG